MGTSILGTPCSKSGQLHGPPKGPYHTRSPPDPASRGVGRGEVNFSPPLHTPQPLLQPQEPTACDHPRWEAARRGQQAPGHGVTDSSFGTQDVAETLPLPRACGGTPSPCLPHGAAGRDFHPGGRTASRGGVTHPPTVLVGWPGPLAPSRAPAGTGFSLLVAALSSGSGPWVEGG